jgi:hypothetical protein
MPLAENDKDELARSFQLLVDLNEPEALVASMARMAERIATGRALAPATDNERNRWRIVANALNEALAAVTAANGPEAQKLAAHMAQWTAGTQEGAPGPSEAKRAP